MIDRIAQLLAVKEDRASVGGSAWDSEASVLVPLCLNEGRLKVTLIRRAISDRIHGGQMGFPGGMIEDKDKGDLLRTALRETEEELGIHPEDISVIGSLNPRNTVVSRILVTPYVGSIPFPYSFSPDPVEVQSIHTASVDELLNTREEAEASFDFPPPVYRTEDQPVWGLTARILTELATIIRPVLEKQIKGNKDKG